MKSKLYKLAIPLIIILIVGIISSLEISSKADASKQVVSNVEKKLTTDTVKPKIVPTKNKTVQKKPEVLDSTVYTGQGLLPGVTLNDVKLKIDQERQRCIDRKMSAADTTDLLNEVAEAYGTTLAAVSKVTATVKPSVKVSTPSKSSGNTSSGKVSKPSSRTKTPTKPSTTVKQPTNNSGIVSNGFDTNGQQGRVLQKMTLIFN